jgi:hypothetical protein
MAKEIIYTFPLTNYKNTESNFRQLDFYLQDAIQYKYFNDVLYGNRFHRTDILRLFCIGMK